MHCIYISIEVSGNEGDLMHLMFINAIGSMLMHDCAEPKNQTFVLDILVYANSSIDTAGTILLLCQANNELCSRKGCVSWCNTTSWNRKGYTLV